MTDSDFYGIAGKYIGRSYDLDDYNCRHLACDFMQDMGIDAYDLFGIGKSESVKTWRDSFRSLSKHFAKVKEIPATCLLLVYSDRGNHVAIKHKHHVLHNFGANKNGMVLMTDYLSFKDSYHRIDCYLFPVK